MQLPDYHQEEFARCVDEKFSVTGDPAGAFDIRLVDVNGRTNTPGQEIFALLFHGPRAPYLPQGIHKLVNERLGELDIFLVPVGQDSDGFQYEAVFNRLVPPKQAG